MYQFTDDSTGAYPSWRVFNLLQNHRFPPIARLCKSALYEGDLSLAVAGRSIFFAKLYLQLLFQCLDSAVFSRPQHLQFKPNRHKVAPFQDAAAIDGVATWHPVACSLPIKVSTLKPVIGLFVNFSPPYCSSLVYALASQNFAGPTSFYCGLLIYNIFYLVQKKLIN